MNTTPWAGKIFRIVGAAVLAVAATTVAVVGASPAPAAATSAIEVSVGGSTTCGQSPAGIYCWGDDLQGVTTTDSSFPTAPLTVPTGVAIQTFVSDDLALCVIDGDDDVRCWGDFTFGVTGGAAEGEKVTLPGSTGSTRPPASAISTGSGSVCAVHGAGEVACWGWQSNGQLGNGVSRPEALNGRQPVTMPTGRTAVDVRAGGFSNCAVLDNGALSCWGTGLNGAATTPSDPIVFANGARVTDLDGGGGQYCAVLDDSSVACIGEANGLTPATVDLGTIRTPLAVAQGASHTCVIVTGGEVRCWGDNGHGQLGLPLSTTSLSAPLANVAGLPEAVSISAGKDTTCIVSVADDVHCWGKGSDGQLGNARTADSATPVLAGQPTATLSLGTGQSATVETGPITFGLAFNMPVLGTPSIDLSGDLAFTSSALTGSGQSHTMTVSGVTGNGSVTADFDESSVTGVFGTPLNNSATQQVRVANDAPIPTVTLGSGQTGPFNAGPITFDINFNEAVTGLAAADIGIRTTPTSGGSLTTGDLAISGSGTDYVFTIGTVTGNGELDVLVPGAVAIDSAGIDNVPSPSSVTVTVDQQAPTPTISLLAGQNAATNQTPIAFIVEFDEDVTGFSAGGITLSGSAQPSGLTVSRTRPDRYLVVVQTVDASGDVVITIPAGAAMDLSGNPSLANAASAGNTVTVSDDTPPVLVAPTVTVTGTTDPGLPTGVVTFTVTAEDLASDSSSGGSIPTDPQAGNPGVGPGPGGNGPGVPVVPGQGVNGQPGVVVNAVAVGPIVAAFNQAIVPVCSPASGSAFPIGDTTVNCTATDPDGNSTSAAFTVQVTDNESPVLTVPTVNLDVPNGATGGVATFVVQATDNSGTVTVTCSADSGDTFPVGVTTVACTATDPSGNTTSASFDVTVAELAAPTTTVPATTVPTMVPPATTIPPAPPAPPAPPPGPPTTTRPPPVTQLPETGGSTTAIRLAIPILLLGVVALMTATRRQPRRREG